MIVKDIVKLALVNISLKKTNLPINFFLIINVFRTELCEKRIGRDCIMWKLLRISIEISALEIKINNTKILNCIKINSKHAADNGNAEYSRNTFNLLKIIKIIDNI